jgi:hypothetical protein
MVTTTDFGNPLCFPEFYSEPRDPEKGAPITTNCNDRIARFTWNSSPPETMPEACTDVCPNEDLAPADPFINFSPEGNNVPDAPEVDIDGDGVPDGAVAQTLACIAPVGIDGCGYEQPLENMLQALNPNAQWNLGDSPFLRDDSLIAIVIATNEVDCSVKDYTIMENEEFQEVDPDDGVKRASSAICWNAGVTCDGPDADGIYSDCRSVTEVRLQPVGRYTGYLVDELRENQGRGVVMLAIVGVPHVTAHNPNTPHEPTQGGVFDLVYRTWQDGVYPAGDILPEDAQNGKDAASKQFDYGILRVGRRLRGAPLLHRVDLRRRPPRCSRLPHRHDLRGDRVAVVGASRLSSPTCRIQPQDHLLRRQCVHALQGRVRGDPRHGSCDRSVRAGTMHGSLRAKQSVPTKGRSTTAWKACAAPIWSWK